MKLGLIYTRNSVDTTWYGSLVASGTSAIGYFLMPVDASSLGNGLVACSTCAVEKYFFEMLPTKYRVVKKDIYDGVITPLENGTDQPTTFTYKYDGGAVNDAVHSVGIATYTTDNDRFTPAYAEYRGNAAVTEIGPDNRATTTIYQQDDIFRGQALYSYTAAKDYSENFDVKKYPGVDPFGYTAGGDVNMFLPSFCNGNTSWTCTGSGTATRADLEGDEALSLSGAITVNRTSSPSYISEKESAILQFRTAPSTTGNTRQLLLTVNSGGISLGISVRRDANNKAYLQSECTGCSGGFSPTIIVPAGTTPGTYQDNSWYLLFLVVDRAKAHLQVRARNDRSVYARLDLPLPEQQGRSWYFSAENSAGFTSYLDTYQEGELHSLTLATLQSYKPAEIDYPRRVNGIPRGYPTINIFWTYPISVSTFTFSGADYQIAQTEYNYDISLQGGVQYWNVTDIYQSVWVNNNFVRYFQERKQYYPNAVICLSQEKPEFLRLWIGENPYLTSTDGIQPTGASSIDLQEFYQLFSEKDDGCIDLQAKAFK